MPRQRPIPHDVVERFGNLPNHRYNGRGEHTSACPECGGEDRFLFWEREAGLACNFWCRRCGFDGFTDDNKPGYTPSPEKLVEIQETRKREAEREERRLRNKINAMREAAYWHGWHDAMDSDQRGKWNERGVCDFLIDYYSLGYKPEHTYYHEDLELKCPALTIPHYETGWNLINIQFRLQNPAPGAGRYRQTAGLPAAMFNTEPEEKLKGAALVVEGAVKSIVLYQHLGTSPLGFPMRIVGIPSIHMTDNMVDVLADCEPIYIGLDPDAFRNSQSPIGDTAVKRAIKMLGRDRVRVVSWPIKPDDMLVEYGADAELMKTYLRDAMRV